MSIELHKDAKALRAALTDLARLRHDLALVKEREAETKKKIEESFGTDLLAIKDEKSRTASQIEDAECLVRQLALGLHSHGVILPKPTKIRNLVDLEYDEPKAVEFCYNNMRGLISLDKRGFESVARKAAFDFVEKVRRKQVTIARDLSEWLGGEDGPVS